MAEKSRRIEFRDWKTLQRYAQDVQAVQESIRDWKEAVCQTPEMNCYPEQFREFSGAIYRDDCEFAVAAGRSVCLRGTIDRAPRAVMEEALTHRRTLDSAVKRLDKKLTSLAAAYGTFPDLLDVKTGAIQEHEEVKRVGELADDDEAAAT